MPSKSFGSVKIFSPRYSREEVVQLLKERLPELAKALPLRRVVLFGSYARGNFTAFSDIDLLVVYADPHRSDAYGLVKKTLNLLGLQPHVLSPLPANYNKRRGCPIEDASPLTDTKVPHIEWDERRLKEPDTCAP